MGRKIWFVMMAMAGVLPFASVAFADDVTVDSVPPELRQYIDQADDSYHWEIVDSRTNPQSQSWLVELTSQTWHGIPWKHYMIIVAPKTLSYPDASILFITGGRVGRMPGDQDWVLAELLASQSGSHVSLLFQVPNQPLFDNLSEDALIAETLIRAIAERDATWPALFPMAKSAIRAMDATQEVLKQEANGEIKQFMVTGASKRGWTTWLTAASGDERVVAIAPIVIDTLNIQKQMQYQVDTWGTWSQSIHDYTDRDLLDIDPAKMDDFLKRLWKMVDPYFYRSKMTLPKLLVHGTNDPYWTVDATQNYWDGLTGPKYIITLSNVGHNLGNKQLNAYATIIAFAKNAFQNGTWPEFRWELSENSEAFLIDMNCELPIDAIRIWSATSETKDFRQAEWSSVEGTKSIEKSQIRETVKKPQSGHIAFFVEIVTKSDGMKFSVTTQVWRK